VESVGLTLCRHFHGHDRASELADATKRENLTRALARGIFGLTGLETPLDID
jgi:hypothetical protein